MCISITHVISKPLLFVLKDKGRGASRCINKTMSEYNPVVIN